MEVFMIKNRHLTDTATSEKGAALGFNKGLVPRARPWALIKRPFRAK